MFVVFVAVLRPHRHVGRPMNVRFEGLIAKDLPDEVEEKRILRQVSPVRAVFRAIRHMQVWWDLA